MANYQIRELTVQKGTSGYNVSCYVDGAGGTIKINYMANPSMSATQGLNNYLNGKAKEDPKYNLPTIIRTQLADRISGRLGHHSKKSYSPKAGTFIAHSYSVQRTDEFFG